MLLSNLLKKSGKILACTLWRLISCVLFWVEAGVIFVAGILYYEVMLVPAPEMNEKYINEILGRESPVYYNDGTTQFGILFEDIHRQYYKYDEIPQNFIKALLAAEDNCFFRHYGVDIPGIGRAFLVNYRAGRTVQGGSSLTQQTAKNLFKRESRSLEAKVRELWQALRLEYYFPKEKILEFYCNQFYVSGNGHGLGVAARYFFDKEPAELTLVEAAFIAGCVKQPNYYNPFLKKNREDPEAAKKRTHERVRYVLQQMRKNGMLTQEEFLAARTTELTFKQGRMSYEQNATMDLVKEGASSPILTEILEENGISNLSTSGARIITTIDKKLQDQTQHALRSHLSQLDVLLRGYKRGEVLNEYGEMVYTGDEDLVPGAFVFGKVQGLGQSGQVFVELAGGQMGLIMPEGFDRLAVALAGSLNPGAKAAAARRNTLRAQLQAGDPVYVSIRQERGPKNEFLLNLERYPKVEGGAIVLQQGAIRAMSGGMSNVHFNRATSARRPMGSAFKTFVYAAALQLGWSPTDLLDNRRNTFYFMNQAYAPHPDHNSPFAHVSMSWAGVKSENLATIWLLYHLTDRLETPALKEIAQKTGMAPQVQNGRLENYDQFKKRMQNTFGLWISKTMEERAAYDAAVRALKTDFLFNGNQQEYSRLSFLPYGSAPAGAKTQDGKPAPPSPYPTFQGIRSRLPQLMNYRQAVKDALPPMPPSAYADPEFQQWSRERAWLHENSSPGALYRSESGVYIYSLREEAPANWEALSLSEVQAHTDGMSPGEEHAFWQHVLLEAVISAESVAMVEQQMKIERERLAKNGAYSLDTLCELRDFRILLGLRYMILLAQACGVESHMEPVLSMALGANVVTLAEMARVYEAMVTGMRFDPAAGEVMERLAAESRGDRDGLSIIERIVMPDGRVVYERDPHTQRIFDERTSASIGSILQNVVAYGTGNYAAKNVKLHSNDPERKKKLASVKRPLPLMGKTGTANEYRNAAFFGFVPVLTQDDPGLLALENGYTVGVYAGYDINEPMVRGGVHITGSLGALPIWTAIAQALIDDEQTGERVDLTDLRFNAGLALRYPEIGQVFLPIDPGRGGIITGKAGARQHIAPAWPAILDVGIQEKGPFTPQRNILPFWRYQKKTRETKGSAHIHIQPREDANTSH